MIALVDDFSDDEKASLALWKDFGPALQKEYDFWMDGADQVGNNQQYRRVCKIDDVTLNRYWDDSDLPRPESYKEDVELADKVYDPALLYRHLRAACESGWDFSSRWYTKDGSGLMDIEAAHVIPVDLNVLLAATERLLAVYHQKMGNEALASKLSKAHVHRLKALGSLFWQESVGWYTDLNLDGSARIDRTSMAGAFPLFAGYADPEKASIALAYMSKHFLSEGGLLSTNVETDQQWDAPNGWAPLQWIGYRAAERFGDHELANKIAQRWMHLNESVYQRTEKMMEKYNVADLSLDAGGGEYDLQDGFGWTNGVYMALKRSMEVRNYERIRTTT
jgi:alpha,alpha-trehalase